MTVEPARRGAWIAVPGASSEEVRGPTERTAPAMQFSLHSP
ncbi:MAG TPA: hypothetical protein VH063_12850 [Gaiellaceae bacterium]|nr:hypothetical protein [Gaiellaceae bacterium]